MKRSLVAVTTDPDRAWDIANLTPREFHVESICPHDPLPSGMIVGMIVDLDNLLLDRCGRARMVEKARRLAASFPVAVVSFNLDDCQHNSLLATGVIVSRALDEWVVHRVLGLPRATAAANRLAA